MDQLEQNTQDWLQFRKTRLGSSDASIIMGQSPYCTPHQLWLEKTGRVVKEQLNSFVINRGNFFEPIARARYELRTDLDLPATIKVHPRYKFLMASLDGYSEEANVVLEIKCFTSKKNFEMAKAGIVPPMYVPQVHHQLMVTGAKEGHFFCCLIEKDQTGHDAIVDDALVVVLPDAAYQEKLLAELITFYRYMQEDVAPPLTDKDYLEAEDQRTVMLFSQMKKLKADIQRKQRLIAKVLEEIDLAEDELEDLKEEAIEHVESFSHPKIAAVGIKMIKNKNGHWQVRLAGEAEEVA